MDFLWISYGFSYGFPMDFLWISYGFPMDFLWISYGKNAGIAGVQTPPGLTELWPQSSSTSSLFRGMVKACPVGETTGFVEGGFLKSKVLTRF